MFGLFKKAVCRHEWSLVSFEKTGGMCFCITGARPQRELVQSCGKCGKEKRGMFICPTDKLVELTPDVAAQCLDTEFPESRKNKAKEV